MEKEKTIKVTAVFIGSKVEKGGYKNVTYLYFKNVRHSDTNKLYKRTECFKKTSLTSCVWFKVNEKYTFIIEPNKFFRTRVLEIHDGEIRYYIKNNNSISRDVTHEDKVEVSEHIKSSHYATRRYFIPINEKKTK